jgi:hypothetical protein
MLSHSNPAPISNDNQNKLKFVWFIDGVGIQTGTNTYTIRASNFFLNLQKISGFTAGTLAFLGSSIPYTLGFQDSDSFRVKDTNHKFAVWDFNFHGNHLGDAILAKLRAGACNVVTTEYETYHDPDCVQIRTAENYWLLSTNPLGSTTCENLYKVSKCIADLAMELGNQPSTIYPDSDPSEPMPPVSPTVSNDNTLSTPAIVGISIASVCAGGVASFFAHKIYKKYTEANAGYERVSTSDSPTFFQSKSTERKKSKETKSKEIESPDFSSKFEEFEKCENYICPVHLDPMKNPQELKCGHNIDLESLEAIQALAIASNQACACPVCRAPILEYKSNEKLKETIHNFKTLKDAIQNSDQDNKEIAIKMPIEDIQLKSISAP